MKWTGKASCWRTPLLYLLALSGFFSHLAAAADAWDTCGADGLSPMARVVSCNGGWDPWQGSCPTGIDFEPGELVSYMAARAPAGGNCRQNSTAYKWSVAYASDDPNSNQYVVSADCSDGSSTASAAIVATKVCGQPCAHSEQVVAEGMLFSGSAERQCIGGCEVEPTFQSGQAGLSICFEMSSGVSTCGIGGTSGDGSPDAGTQWHRTGAVCPSGEDSGHEPYAITGGYNGSSPNTAAISPPSAVEFNGETIDVGSLPAARNCVGTTGGNTLCTPPVDTPPGPDNGTPGTPAEPDGRIVVSGPSGSTTVYVYNAATGGASSTGGGGGGSQPGGDDDDDAGDSAGNGAYSTRCDTQPTCSNRSSIECAILRQQWSDTCRTFGSTDYADSDLRAVAGLTQTDGELIGQLYRDIDVSEDLGWSIPGMSSAQCPASPTFTFNGETYEFPLSAICDWLRWIGVFVVIGAVVLSLRIISGE